MLDICTTARRANLHRAVLFLVSILLAAASEANSPLLARSTAAPGNIAFVSTRDGSDQIYLIDLDGSRASRLSPLAGDHDAPSFARDGRKFAFVALFNGTHQIFVADRDGNHVRRLTNPPAQAGTPAFSPDGGKIAYIAMSGPGPPQVYVMNSDGSGRSRLGNISGGSFNPSFSPDGKRIVFDALDGATTQIYVMKTDGSGVTRLTNSPRPALSPSFAPDGRTIALVCTPGGSFSYQICAMNADGSNVIGLTDWPRGNKIVMNANMSPHYTPDGRKILFSSVRSGNEQIYIMNADGKNAVMLTHPPGTNSNPQFVP